MMTTKPRLVEATVTRVMGPDLFEAKVDLGFDIETTRRLKLAGVDSQHLRSLGQDDVQKATEFLRTRIEGQVVLIRPIRKGEHFYARVYYGPEESDLIDEMVLSGFLRRFDRNGNGDDA
jgi:hypothetical protein